MLFLPFLCILADKAATQTPTTVSTPIIATTTVPAATTTIQDCDSCFLVAQIDEAVLGARASYYTRLGNFTLEPSGLTGSLSLAVLPTASVITYNGTPVTSPTVYNVFTSFLSVQQSLNADGSCVTIMGPIFILPTPLSVQIPTDASSDIITQAEGVFISQVGGVSCLAGGIVVSSTVPVPVSSPITALTFTLPEQISATPTGSGQNSSNSHTISTTSTSSNITHATPTNNNTGIASIVPSDNLGLSQSAKLGIGIGIGVSGAVIFVLIGALVWKHNTRKKHTKGRTDPLSELPSKEPDSLAELENKIPPQELETIVAPQELENTVAPQELSVEQRPDSQ